MSASREKKNRQELAAQGHVDPKAERAAKEAAEQKKNRLLYGGIAAEFYQPVPVLQLFRTEQQHLPEEPESQCHVQDASGRYGRGGYQLG